MAGSIVVTQSEVAVGTSAVVGLIERPGISAIISTSIVWTSDAAGAVSGNTVSMPSGTIVTVNFSPGAGVLAPTNLYDVTFTNA